jgi:excisionase family DNA binding protein
MPAEPEPLYTIPQAASLLRVSRWLLYALIKERRLPAVRLGHALRLRPRDLERFIEERLTTPARTHAADD